MNLFDLDVPVPHEDGSMISEKVSRVVELIKNYDPNLDVRWIPPGQRAPGDAAFAIVERTQGREVIAMYVQTEEDMDERVLARIYAADSARRGNILNDVDAKNQAVMAMRQAKYKEKMDEALDLSYSILKSPKHEYKHNGVVYR